MHSGNNSVEDRKRYSRAGAHGTVGKGDDMVAKVGEIYGAYMEDKLGTAVSLQRIPNVPMLSLTCSVEMRTAIDFEDLE